MEIALRGTDCETATSLIAGYLERPRQWEHGDYCCQKVDDLSRPDGARVTWYFFSED
jgi:hypothetical protein